MNLIEAATRYCALRSVAANTRDQYLTAARNLGRCLGRPATASDLTTAALDQLSLFMLAADCRAATINKTMRHLLALARWCRRRRLIRRAPRPERLPERRRSPVSWTIGELEQVLAAIAALPPPWNRLLAATCLLSYDTGLRIGDAVRAVILHESPMVVGVQEQKTGKHRSFNLHDQTAAAVKLLWGEDAPAVGDPVLRYRFASTTPLRRRLKRARVAAGLAVDRWRLFQGMRRTAATMARGVGEDATTFMGHSNSWVTNTFYIDPTAAPPLTIGLRLPRPRLGA